MRKDILSKEQINEVLSRAEYWDEVVKRRNNNVPNILMSELNEVVSSLGMPVLWILKEYAKDSEESTP